MKWFLLFNIILLNACSNLPANIQNPPSVDIHLRDVQENSSQYINQPVRWGGTVIEVQNEADESSMQILFYPLNYFGRPKLNQQASGRFMTVSKQFLDPAIYSEGTKITIAGTVQNTLVKQIGNKTIPLPVVTIENHHIWPEYRQADDWDYHYPHYFYGYRRSYYPYNYYRRGYRYNNCY